jgi:hypothetical protein
MELKFDEDNLERVAEVVKHFNPHAHGDLVAYMKQVARNTMDHHDLGYVATGGFMLTFFKMEGEDDNLYIKASVAAECFHTVELK